MSSNNLIEVPPDYICPLCPDHKDDEFVWSDLLKAPICRGCSHDIWALIAWTDERDQDIILDRIEQITGLSFRQYQLIEFESVFRKFQNSPGTSPEELKRMEHELARLKNQQ